MIENTNKIISDFDVIAGVMGVYDMITWDISTSRIYSSGAPPKSSLSLSDINKIQNTLIREQFDSKAVSALNDYIRGTMINQVLLFDLVSDGHKELKREIYKNAK